MTRTISLKDLQVQFNDLLTHIAPGDELIVENAGTPIVKISPLAPPDPAPPQRRQLGLLQGQIWISPDFDAPDPEFEDLFYNGPIFPETKPQENPG